MPDIKTRRKPATPKREADNAPVRHPDEDKQRHQRARTPRRAPEREKRQLAGGRLSAAARAKDAAATADQPKPARRAKHVQQETPPVVPGPLASGSLSVAAAAKQRLAKGGAKRKGVGPARLGGTVEKLTIIAVPASGNAGQGPVLDGNGGFSWETPGSGSVIDSVNHVAAAGAAQTIPDVTTDQSSHLVLTAASCALTFPAAARGKSFSILLEQDATGGRDFTVPGNVRWIGGVKPALTTTASKQDLLSFICLDGTSWVGAYCGGNI